MNGLANVTGVEGSKSGWGVTLDGSHNPELKDYLDCGTEEEARRLLSFFRRMEEHTIERVIQWFERDPCYVNCREVKALRAGTYRLHPNVEVDEDLSWPLK